MYVTEGYKPNRMPSVNSKFGGEKDTQSKMTERAKAQSLEFEQFVRELKPDQLRAVNEALCRLNDYVGGSGHKKIFGIIIPNAVTSLSRLLSNTPE